MANPKRKVHTVSLPQEWELRVIQDPLNDDILIQLCSYIEKDKITDSAIFLELKGNAKDDDSYTEKPSSPSSLVHRRSSTKLPTVSDAIDLGREFKEDLHRPRHEEKKSLRRAFLNVFRDLREDTLKDICLVFLGAGSEYNRISKEKQPEMSQDIIRYLDENDEKYYEMLDFLEEDFSNVAEKINKKRQELKRVDRIGKTR